MIAIAPPARGYSAGATSHTKVIEPPCCSLKLVAITSELRQLIEQRQTLSLDQAHALMQRILAGEASELELAALLGAIATRGETAEEIAGFALGLRAAATTLPLTEAEREELVDTCGTGGDGCGTFNISTAAALVAAAAGVKVAKHGNRAVTSKCGSADVLDALGIPISLSPEAAVDALRAHNFCFLLAPAHHPAMRAVLPVRRALGIRTVFNVLGPLLNPAGARRQVMGVYAPHLVPLVAKAMTLLGVQHAFVVHGEGGLDELSLAGTSTAAEVHSRDGHTSILQHSVRATDVGLLPASPAALAGGHSASENATVLRGLFGMTSAAPETGPRRDIVLLNAAAVFLVAGFVNSFPQGVALAAATINSGAVARLIEALQRS